MKKMIVITALTVTLPALATVGTEIQRFNLTEILSSLLSELVKLKNNDTVLESSSETMLAPPSGLVVLSAEASSEPNTAHINNNPKMVNDQ